MKEQIDAGRSLIAAMTARQTAPDQAAWVKEYDIDEWRLYLVYNRIATEGTRITYRILRAILEDDKSISGKFASIPSDSIFLVSPWHNVGEAIVSSASVWRQQEQIHAIGGFTSDSGIEAALYYPPVPQAVAA